MGKIYGYYPEDPLTAWKVDSIGDSLEDLTSLFLTLFFRTPDEDAKKALLEKFLAISLPAWLTVIDKRLEANSSKHYIVGDKLSTADFCIASWVYGTVLNQANAYNA